MKISIDLPLEAFRTFREGGVETLSFNCTCSVRLGPEEVEALHVSSVRAQELLREPVQELLTEPE